MNGNDLYPPGIWKVGCGVFIGGVITAVVVVFLIEWMLGGWLG